MLLGGYEMDSTKLETSVINKLEKNMRYISYMIKQRGREILDNYPITPPQFVALQHLQDSRDLTIGELSKKMYLAFSTTTDLVDRMEKNNLIERVRDPKDRRVVRVHLLDKGKEIIKEVIEKRQEYLREILSSYSEEELEMLRLSFDKLYNEMKSHENNKKSNS